MDKQDGQDREMKHELATKSVTGCASQVVNYLNAAGIEVGLLISFGNPNLE